MKVNDIATKLPAESKLKTLGGRSSFTVTNRNRVVTIINSRGRELILTDVLVSIVLDRYKSLPIERRLMSSEYVDPKWPDVPNRVFCFYIARLIDHILNL